MPPASDEELGGTLRARSAGGTTSEAASAAATSSGSGKSLAVRARVLLERAKTQPEFRQRLMVIVGVVLTLGLMLLATSTGSVVGGGNLGRGGGARDSSSKGDARVAMASVGLSSKTRRQREIEEGLDIDGADLVSVRRRFGTQAENERAQAVRTKATSSKALQCFKSFPVQISRSSSKFTYFAPAKKVFDLAVLQRSLKRMGWEQEKDLKKATLVLKGNPHVEFRKLKQGEMYYDMVSALGRIGSKKKTQLATLRNHVKKFGCSFESLGIFPESYDMNRPSDCKKFFQHEDKGRMWVFKSCKSGEGSKGLGISVTDDLSSYRTEWGECEQDAFNYVAQAYIEHPMLIKNRKFDMRVYLLVASTNPYVVFFNPGYLRRSLAEYKPASTERDDVLTNYHVQMNREDFTPDQAMWPFSKFIEYVQEEGLCEACGDIEIRIAKIARMVFDSGRSYYKRFPGSFQIVGLDFMMDANLNPMFIEGNVSPGLGSHDLRWKKDLMDDLITQMYTQAQRIAETPDEFDMQIGDRVYGPKGNYWELVVHEKMEQCDKKYKFNPCDELPMKD